MFGGMVAVEAIASAVVALICDSPKRRGAKGGLRKSIAFDSIGADRYIGLAIVNGGLCCR